MVKKIAIGVLAVVVALVGFVATRPSSYTVARSVTVAAPADITLGQVSDFHKWAAWSPWGKLDPNMKVIYSGAESGTGAVYSWTGNDQVGEGRMTITNLVPNQKVEIKLEFIKPWTSTSATEFTTVADGAGTKITWSMTGHNGFVEKAFTAFVDMEGMLAKDFDKGLADLKKAAEAEAKAVAEAAAAKEAAAAEAAKAAEAAAAEGTAVAAPATP